MLRIGLAGCGVIAAQHLAGWKLLGGRASVTAVCDVDAGRAAAAAAAAGGARIYDGFETLIEAGEVDAIDICLPHHLHTPAILLAARAGKHILCEKPLCISAADAATIREAVRAAGITFMCAHNQLFEPAIARARAAIESGRLGRIYLARTTDCFHLRLEDDRWGWRGKRATMGGGELIDTGYHPTYTLLYLMGLAGQRPSEVTALLGRNRHQALEGEDTGHVLVRFSGGAVGQILTSWAFALPPGSHTFHVVGEHGQIYGRKNSFFFSPEGGDAEESVDGAVNAYHEQLPHFVECVASGSRPIQTEEDGAAVLQLILSAYESETSKRTVEFGMGS